MKRLICLFLMLWLPLFTGSAWAMSAQMQFDELQSVLAVSTQTAETPCHDMQHEAAPAPVNSEQPQHTHCTGHSCFACSVCIYASSFAMPALQHVFSPLLSYAKPLQYDESFASQLYPPALKPPIAA